jgi:hypothetical protein
MVSDLAAVDLGQVLSKQIQHHFSLRRERAFRFWRYVLRVRSAVIYTLVANCRLHGVEPHAYLKDVLERLPTATNQTVAQLTPLNWKRAHQVPVKLAA